MAVDAESADAGDGLRDQVRSIAKAYRHMGMPAERYLLVVVTPGIVVALAVGLAVVFLAPPLFVALPVGLLGLLAPLVALVYPKLLADRRRREIREDFHLFLTHITVLSMTNIDRVEVFRTLAKVDEYGALAEEMGRITALVDTWNQSLDDACRRRSKEVPSELLSDFLERLAYTVGAGQGMDEFLVDEQESIIQEFVIRYEAALAKLDVMKELYLSLMLSVTFILVFATVVPILLGIPATLLIGGIIVMFGLTQLGFLFVINTVAPRDPVWLGSGSERSPMHRVWPGLVAGVALSLLVTGGVFAVGLGFTPLAPGTLPQPLYLALPTTPLLLPGLLMRREEQKVTERDEGFPSFVRALGSVESVKQTSTTNVLKTLRTKDFGALTPNVDNLYKRLRIRIDTEESWRLFADETGSYLIHKFGDMYVVGRRMGGDPRQLGQIISTNFNEVLRVREQRQQSTRTFIGVVYGITAAAMFASFVGLGIAEQMLTITEEMARQNGDFVASVFSISGFNPEVMGLLLLIVVMINAILSSLMIRITDRGHYVSALTHFVLLVWIGCVMAVLTGVMIDGLL